MWKNHIYREDGTLGSRKFQAPQVGQYHMSGEAILDLPASQIAIPAEELPT